MAAPFRPHPISTLLAMVGVLAATLGLAAYVSVGRQASKRVSLQPAVERAGVAIALPAGYAAAADTGDPEVLLTASESGPIVHDPADPERFTKGRRLIVLQVRRATAMPPGQFLSELMGRPIVQSRPLKIAGYPAIELSFSVRSGDREPEPTPRPEGGEAPPPGQSPPNKPPPEPAPADEPPGVRRLGIGASPEWRTGFLKFAVVTLPSGHVISVMLEGPGKPTVQDGRVFEAVTKSISLRRDMSPRTVLRPLRDAGGVVPTVDIEPRGSQPGGRGRGTDGGGDAGGSGAGGAGGGGPAGQGAWAYNGREADERFRNQLFASPLALLDSGHAAPLARMSDTVLFTLPDGDVATVEMLPVYMPALPPSSGEREEAPAGPLGSGGDQAGVDDAQVAADVVRPESAAEVMMRIMAGFHEPKLQGGVFRRRSPNRMTLTQAGRPAWHCLAMAVTPEGSPGLAMLLIARGPIGSEATLGVLANRVADLISFDHRPEDFHAMLVAGARLAARTALAPQGAQGASGRRVRQIAWTTAGRESGVTRETPDGAIEALATPTYFHQGLRFLRTVEPRPDGQSVVGLVQQVRTPRGFIELNRTASTRPAVVRTSPPGLANSASPNSPQSSPHPSTSSTRALEPADLLLRLAVYVPGNRLLDAARLAGGEPAIVLTDSFPGLENQGFPGWWCVLVAPAPPGIGRPAAIGATTGPTSRPAGNALIKHSRYLHALGTGRTLVAHFDDAGNLLGTDFPGLPPAGNSADEATVGEVIRSGG